MTRDSAKTKQLAIELIGRLPPTQLFAIVSLLESMLDPVSLAIANAPADDLRLTPAEERSLDEAREWLRNNRGIPHSHVLTELGITAEEIEHNKESK